jgi:hypothetical protein
MNLEKDLSKYANKPIFYVTLDPERALGLEDILPNYTIFCPYKSQLTEKLRRDGAKLVVLEEEISAKELERIVQRGTYGILHFVHDRKIVVKNDCLMVLKNSQLIEDFCKKQGWKLLAPKAKVAEQFENKISQYRALANKVPYPLTFIANLEKISDTMLMNHELRIRNHDSKFIIHNSPLVLQFNRGHSGNTTFFIKSRKDLKNLASKFPKREAKISEFINGKTYTLNCLVLRNGEVITGSISEQITGLKSATTNPNTTCGNDFTSPGKLSKKQVKKIQEIAKDTGSALYRKGYRGLFGIDVIIQQKTGEAYFIEVNTHQPASISFEAKLHRQIGKVPLLAYFIFDSLTHPSLRRRGLGGGKPPILLPIQSRQIIYRNKTRRILSKKYLEKKYMGRGIISRMKYTKPNEELYRTQQLNNKTIEQ